MDAAISGNILNHSELFQDIVLDPEVIPLLPSKGLKLGNTKLCPERKDQWYTGILEPVFSYCFRHEELSLIKLKYIMRKLPEKISDACTQVEIW